MFSPNGRILQLDSSAATATGSTRTDANGKPVRSYIKTILRAGVTVKNVAGQSVTITRDFLDSIAGTFKTMRAAGIKSPIQAGHTDSPDLTRGYVTDLFRDGDDLIAHAEMIGDDGIMLASRSDVSVYVDPEYEVGGHKYANALVHLACVPNPQVPGLGAFAPIAASLSGQVFRFSQDSTSGIKVGDRVRIKGNPHMPGHKEGVVRLIDGNALGIEFDAMPGMVHRWYVPDEVVKEDSKKEEMKMSISWKPIAIKLSLDVTKLDDTTGPAAVEAAITACIAERDAAAKSLNEANTRNAALQLSVSKGPSAIDPAMLDEYAELTSEKFGTLVEAGKITPAQKDKFVALFTGTAGKRPAICLSATAAKSVELPGAIANEIFGILSLSIGKKPGEKTGDQTNDAGADAKAAAASFASRVSSYMPGAAVKAK